MSDSVRVRQQVADQAHQQLQCIEALLLLSRAKCPGLDLSAVLPPSAPAARQEVGGTDSVAQSHHVHWGTPPQSAKGLPQEEQHPAATGQASPASPGAQGTAFIDYDSYALERYGPSWGGVQAIIPPPVKQWLLGAASTVSPQPSPSHPSTTRNNAGYLPWALTNNSLEKLSPRGVHGEKRRAMVAADADPTEGQKEPRTGGIKNVRTIVKPRLDASTTWSPEVEGLSPDLQNAAQFIEQRRGVYFKIKEKAFEAQLDTARYRKTLKLDSSGPSVYYLGLFRVEPATIAQLQTAQNRATKTVDRARIKLLEGSMSEAELQKELHFPLADYFTDWEIEERKNRAMKDYCNFLKHNADARRAHHGGKGVAARRRTNGVVSYEARISKHVVGTFGTYPSLEEAKYAYDVGAILCKGPHYRLNYPVDKYMNEGVFLPTIHVPEPLRTIIQNHLNGMTDNDRAAWLQRVSGYYHEGQCPFYALQRVHNELPPISYPSRGWARVAQSTVADATFLSGSAITSGPPIMPDAHDMEPEQARTGGPAGGKGENGWYEQDRIAALLAGVVPDGSAP